MCYLKSIYQTFKYSSHEKSELFDEFHALGQKQDIIYFDGYTTNVPAYFGNILFGWGVLVMV